MLRGLCLRVHLLQVLPYFTLSLTLPRIPSCLRLSVCVCLSVCLSARLMRPSIKNYVEDQ